MGYQVDIELDKSFLRNYHPCVKARRREAIQLNERHLEKLSDRIHKGWERKNRYGNFAYNYDKCKGVYFFAGEFVINGTVTPLVKIGSADNTVSREGMFKVANPRNLFLIYFHRVEDKEERIRTEKNYQNEFSQCQFKKEWFHLKPVVKGLGLDWSEFIVEC